MSQTESAFGPTIETRLQEMNILLIPASSHALGEGLLIYGLDRETGQPLPEEKILDLRELFHEFAIDHTAQNPAGTLLAIRYGASSAIIQQAIDRSNIGDMPIPLSREMTPEETSQYYRLLVYDIRRWEYIMDDQGSHIRADLSDLLRPLKQVLDHLNRLEIPFRVEHLGHTDMLVILDPEASQQILNVRNGFYEKIVGRHPEAMDVARALIQNASLPDDKTGGDGDKGK